VSLISGSPLILSARLPCPKGVEEVAVSLCSNLVQLLPKELWNRCSPFDGYKQTLRRKVGFQLW